MTCGELGEALRAGTVDDLTDSRREGDCTDWFVRLGRARVVVVAVVGNCVTLLTREVSLFSRQLHYRAS